MLLKHCSQSFLENFKLHIDTQNEYYKLPPILRLINYIIMISTISSYFISKRSTACVCKEIVKYGKRQI